MRSRGGLLCPHPHPYGSGRRTSLRRRRSSESYRSLDIEQHHDDAYDDSDCEQDDEQHGDDNVIHCNAMQMQCSAVQLAIIHKSSDQTIRVVCDGDYGHGHGDDDVQYIVCDLREKQIFILLEEK